MICFCYLTLILTYFISEMILGIDSNQYPILLHVHLIVLMFIILPATSLLCLARQWNQEGLMKRSVLNRRYKDYLPYQKIVIRYTILQAIYAAIMFNLVRLINLYLTFHFSLKLKEKENRSMFNMFLKMIWSKYYDFGNNQNAINVV